MVKVMTLNINQYAERHGPWQQRKNIIADALREVKPDIVALQAVMANPAHFAGLDQATQLTEALHDYPYVYFQPAMQDEQGRFLGSAFISRLKPLITEHRPLSFQAGLEDPFKRVILQAKFKTGAGVLTLYNAHFSWVEQQAIQNITEALAYIDNEEFAAILGDFNQSPESRVLQPLKNAGWQDVWEVLQPDNSGFTFEAPEPNLRIDYVWANMPLQKVVRGINLVANKNDGNIHASDHYGIVVEFDL